jgi:hypothetical protein
MYVMCHAGDHVRGRHTSWLTFLRQPFFPANLLPSPLSPSLTLTIEVSLVLFIPCLHAPHSWLYSAALDLNSTTPTRATEPP